MLGGDELGGGSVGLGVGSFGVGGGGTSSSIFLVGDGRGGFSRFEFWLAFSLVLGSNDPSVVGLSFGDGDTATFAFAFCSSAPPAGIPDSACPVGGDATSTGWLFGSAARFVFGCTSVAGVVVFLVNA